MTKDQTWLRIITTIFSKKNKPRQLQGVEAVKDSYKNYQKLIGGANITTNELIADLTRMLNERQGDLPILEIND